MLTNAIVTNAPVFVKWFFVKKTFIDILQKLPLKALPSTFSKKESKKDFLTHNTLMYFNYHGKAMKMIREGRLCGYEFVEKWNNISPALVLFFYDHSPMPIRQDKWPDYMKIIQKPQENEKK